MKERKKNKAPTLLGIMCSDYNLPYLENCLYSIRKTMPDDIDIVVFGFNKDITHTRTQIHCAQRNIPYVFLGSQEYVPQTDKYFTGTGREGANYRFDILLMTHFCERFYKKGYKEIYILHPDTIILKDFRPLFNAHKKDKWSIIMPYVSIRKICMLNNPAWVNQNFNEMLTFEEACQLNSHQIPQTDVRLTGSVVLHNKEFIEALYRQYETEEIIFKELFLDTKYCGDCGWFDMIECIGFKINPILKDVLSEIPQWPTEGKRWPSHLFWLHGVPVRNLATSLSLPIGSKNISKTLKDYL
jgi:hypothetical protein